MDKKAYIVFCPCCCTNTDVEAIAGQTVEVICGSCESEFTLKIDPEKFARHAMHG